MNIFRLDNNPNIAATFYHDSHVRKICVEIAQILQTAYSLERLAAPDCPRNQKGKPRGHGYKNHPICVWARLNLSNFAWVVKHGEALHQEFVFRFGKKHFSFSFIDWCLRNSPQIPVGVPTVQPQCFKNYPNLINPDPVQGYRDYYNTDKLFFFQNGKKKFAKWSKRPIPNWINIDNLSEKTLTNTKNQLLLYRMNTTNNTNAETTINKKRPGAKRKEFNFPVEQEFTLKSLKEQFKFSIPFFKNRMKEAGANIKRVAVDKTGKKGRPEFVFRYYENPA